MQPSKDTLANASLVNCDEYFAAPTRRKFMLVLPGNLHQTSTEDRARQTIVSVDYREVLIRDAIRRLFGDNLFGGTVAPNIQETVTVRLVDVPFEVALQNLTR